MVESDLGGLQSENLDLLAVAERHTSTSTNGTYGKRIEAPWLLGATAASGLTQCAHGRPLEIVEALGQIDHHLPASLANSRRQQRKLVANTQLCRCFTDMAADRLAVTASKTESKVTGDAVKVNGRRTWFVLYQQPLILLLLGISVGATLCAPRNTPKHTNVGAN